MLGGLFSEEEEHSNYNTRSQQYGPVLKQDRNMNLSNKPFSFEIARRSAAGYVGLLNQGSTCYLNSLLQTMFMTPEFRNGIFSLTGDEIGFESWVSSKSVSNEQKNEKEDQDKYNLSETELEDFMSMGFNSEQVILAARKCRKYASFDEILSMLLGESAFSDLPSEIVENDTLDQNETKDQTKKSKNILIQMVKLFSELKVLDIEALSTRELTDSFGWSGRDSFEQHDVHELNRILSSALEESLKGTSQEKLIQTLYSGSFLNSLKCRNCNASRERSEEFVDIPLVVNGFRNLEDSLKSVLQIEVLEGENKYFCENCNERVEAERKSSIGSCPNILTFSLLRFSFDFKTGRRTKLNSKFEYPLTLDMSPFCVEGGIYDLFSVVIHSGDAYGGHYHAFIKSIGEEEEKWINFDDSKVKNIDEQALFSQFSGAESAYMLVYRKRGLGGSEMIPIPWYVHPLLSARVSKIEEQREEEEKFANSIEVGFETDYYYEVESGGLTPVSLNSPIKIVLDRRISGEKMKKMIADEFYKAGMSFPHVEEMVFKRRIGVRSEINFEEKDLIIDNEKNISENGIHDNEVYLCWNGKKIRDKVWDGKTFTKEITVRFLTDVNQQFVIKIRLSLSDKVSEIKKKVTEEAKLFEVEAESDCITITQLAQDTDPAILNNEQTLRSILNLNQTPILFAETTKNYDDLFIVRRRRDVADKVKVHIIDHLNSGWRKDFSLSINKNSTIADLKRIAQEYIEEYSSESFPQTRMRRAVIVDSDGALFLDESMTLEKANIDNDSRVIIEPGLCPSYSVLPVRFVFQHGHGLTLAATEFMIEKNSSLFECKMEIANRVKKSPSEIRFFWMDSWETKGDPLNYDESMPIVELESPQGKKTKEEGLMLWVEEKTTGEEHYVIYIDSFCSRVLSLSPNSLQETDPLKTDSTTVPTILKMLERPVIPSTSTPCHPHSSDTFRLTSLSLSPSSSAQDIKKILTDKGGLLQGMDPDMIRFWLKGSLISIEKLNTPLKKLGLKGYKPIHLQVLDDKRGDEKEKKNKIILYVLTRNAKKKSYNSLSEMEFSFGPNEKPTWMDIHRYVSFLTQQPQKDFALVFFNRRKKKFEDPKWILIDDNILNGKSHFTSEILQGPWNLSDGDLVVIKDLTSEESDPIEDWQSTAPKDNSALDIISSLFTSQKTNDKKVQKEPVLQIRVS